MTTSTDPFLYGATERRASRGKPPLIYRSAGTGILKEDLPAAKDEQMFLETSRHERPSSLELMMVNFYGLCHIVEHSARLTFRSSSIISVCTSPCTDSPFTWVIRSPALRPASWAGLPSSTLYRQKGGENTIHNAFI